MLTIHANANVLNNNMCDRQQTRRQQCEKEKKINSSSSSSNNNNNKSTIQQREDAKNSAKTTHIKFSHFPFATNWRRSDHSSEFAIF
ncbi:hypothetical protein T4A_1334 [Trichinella pseudospiralis]|uniref:Uncharacterized protein n=1 Tax=Trichinella pseudospiralis TaxID=6337 RepID=A0A0V1ENE2_TRIPS|nr:hypothetical protein T4A_1334 [Trichinella pseudospiralis]